MSRIVCACHYYPESLCPENEVTTQPEALRLAEILETSWRPGGFCSAAAAELRRQHDQIERLAAEVANRNRRALDGDEAVSALAKVHAYYEGIEAERDAAVKAITKHNNECQSLCGNGDSEASACGYRSYFEATGRRCPECPTDHKIDWPQDAAIDAAKGKT